MIQIGVLKNLPNFFSTKLMTTPAAAPQGYEWKQTDDGSWSLYSLHFQEATHSSAGAWTETIVRYLVGCGIKESMSSQDAGGINVLEVGVGTGTGLVALLQLFKNAPTNKKLSYLGLELDENLILWMQNNIETLVPSKFGPFDLGPIKELKKENEGFPMTSYRFNNDAITLEILVGDAKLTLPTWQSRNESKFDAIFQDAFSPKNNPDLWDEDWFSCLKSCCSGNGILSTFSAASKVKQALESSGWSIFEGPKFGNKRGSTLARPK